MNFSLAIDDILAEELCKFRVNQQCDIDMVERTLHYYKGYPIFTKSYFRQYYSNAIQTNLLQSISTINWDSIETISKGTIYKVILSSQKNVNFPYISIYDDKVENNFTATFSKIDPRDKVKEHLKALIYNAKERSIYDRYMLGDGNTESFQQFCNEILSIKKLGIKIIYIHSDNDGCKEMGKYIKEKHPNLEWTTQHPTQEQQKNYAHDRYLIIDNKIEIIFTSGICHLMNNSKDFTYIVRRHKQ